MAQNPKSSKYTQLTLAEYAKIKDKLTKNRLKLTFPWIVKACFLVPPAYAVFLIIYYVAHLRFLAEH